MCDITGASYLAIASAVIGAAGSAVQYSASKRQANAYQLQLENDAKTQQAALGRQAEQEARAGAGEMNEVARKALADRALFDVVAGEYGEGNSVDRARTIGSIQADERIATIQDNYGASASERGFQATDLRRSAQDRMASISRPSWLGTGLRIAGAATNAYTDYRAGQPKPPKTST